MGDSSSSSTDEFTELEREIRRMNIDADSIELTYHLRKFTELFLSYIVDDQKLSELLTYLNGVALADGNFAVSMAAVFASHQLGDLVIKETKLRNAMLTILQENFRAIEELKHDGVHRFYNSVTLLGEYYHRKKFSNGKRIHILGQSLLLLLTTELEKEIKLCEEDSSHQMDPEFAKIILSQVTLNGEEAKTEHKQEIEDLNYSIRKCLINVSGLSSRTKAYLLMSLDLFYTNFNLCTHLLDKLYGKYLFDPDQDTSTKQAENGSNSEKKEPPAAAAPPPSQAKDTPSSGSKESSQKSTAKFDSARKLRQVKAKGAAAMARRKDDNNENSLTPHRPPISPPKRPPLNAGKKSPPNSTSPRKDQRAKASSAPSQKPTSTRRSYPERKKSSPTHNSSPPKTQSSTNFKGNSNNRIAETPSSVLKQNLKGASKSSTSPIGSTSNPRHTGSLKVAISPTKHEDNVENLAWDDLTLDDESPQKMNPHTKSFLTFLAQK